MTNLSLAVQTIKENVSALDVGEVMGLEIRRGRCRCPLHGGHDFNCRLYPGDKGFYCHVCKRGGDVLKFAQEYYKMQFKDAVSWFNSTFHLGLDLNNRMDPEEARHAENALKMRKDAQEHKAWKERINFDLFLAADKILEMLEEQRDRNVPKTPDEPWNQLFCEAIRTIPAAKRFAERCYMECIKEKEK